MANNKNKNTFQCPLITIAGEEITLKPILTPPIFPPVCKIIEITVHDKFEILDAISNSIPDEFILSINDTEHKVRLREFGDNYNGTTTFRFTTIEPIKSISKSI